MENEKQIDKICRMLDDLIAKSKRDTNSEPAKEQLKSPDFYEGYKIGLESAQPKWISVDERLPEDDLPEGSDVKVIKVFVTIKAKNGLAMRTQMRHRSTLFDTRGEPFFDWGWRHSAGEVTHWMPLPEPPEEE